jgi:hypothetical protein
MASESQHADAEYRFDVDAFVDWAEAQVDKSRCATARMICTGYTVGDKELWKFRLREAERDAPEDVTLVRSGNCDVIRFEYDDEQVQYQANRVDVTFHEKTLKVTKYDETVCSAGTGTTNRRGPFPL